MQRRPKLFIVTILLFTSTVFAWPGKSTPVSNATTEKIIRTRSDGANRGLSLYDCADGEVHDDGSAENSYGWPDTVIDGRFVEKFTPPVYPFKYSDVCICATQAENFHFFYFIVMYDDNGPGGSPGDEIFSLTTSTITFDDFNSIPMEAHCPVIESGSVYFGVKWAVSMHTGLRSYICADESSTTPINGGYAFDDVNGWRPIQDVFPSYRCMLIRAKGEAFIDCNNNNVNDTREVTTGIPYAVDDGRAEFVEACCSGFDMMRMNQFVVQPGGEVVDRISIAWGDQMEGTPVTVCIFDDPDNDPTNSPENHVLLASAKTTVQNPLTDIFNDTTIGPVYVGEAGDSFSVAFLIENVGAGFPTFLDVHNVQLRSWEILWEGGTADITDLTTGFNPNLEDDYNYTIRAIAAPVDCNKNLIPDVCDASAGGASTDCNNNNIPDECDTAPDFSGGDATICETAFAATVPGPIIGSTGDSLPFDVRHCGVQFSVFGLWIKYRPTSDGTAFFGFTSQTSPFMVSVFDDCPSTGGMQIACNSTNPNGVTFNVLRERTYYLRFAAIGINVGTFSGNFVGPQSLESTSDSNNNGLPDECDCLFDVNNDNVVDVMDFLDARQNEGMCLAFPCTGDVDGDGFVDEQDYMLILNNMGPCQFPRTSNLAGPDKEARKH